MVDRVIEMNGRGARGMKGDASGALGAESVTAATINTGQANAIADKIGAFRSGKAFQAIFGGTNPAAHGLRIDSVADAKQVDGFFGSAALVNGGSGYAMHGITSVDATIGPDAAGGGGFAIDGTGNGSGVVGNRQGVGPGNGAQGARLGSGEGAGGEFRASSTGVCYAVRGLKQNPVAGVAGTGPAVFAINDSTNGEAFYARSASGNTTENTSVVDRLNGSAGTATFNRISGSGARSGLLRAGASHVVPGAASTGTASVIGHDFQISANVTGSSDTRGINVANSATGGPNAYGGVVLVDGANTINYGLFITAANGGTNHAIYSPTGRVTIGGDIRSIADNALDIGTAAARFKTIYAATGTINTSDAREKKWRGELTEAHLRAARRIGKVMGLYQWIDQIAEKTEDGARIHFGVKAQDVIDIFYDEGLETKPDKDTPPNLRHAFLCYDEWEDEFEPVTKKRKIKEKVIEYQETDQQRLVTPAPMVIKQKNGKSKSIEQESYYEPSFVAVEVERTSEVVEIVGERVSRKAGNRYGLRLDQFALFLIAAQEARLAAIEDR